MAISRIPNERERRNRGSYLDTPSLTLDHRDVMASRKGLGKTNKGRTSERAPPLGAGFMSRGKATAHFNPKAPLQAHRFRLSGEPQHWCPSTTKPITTTSSKTPSVIRHQHQNSVPFTSLLTAVLLKQAKAQNARPWVGRKECSRVWDGKSFRGEPGNAHGICSSSSSSSFYIKLNEVSFFLLSKRVGQIPSRGTPDSTQSKSMKQSTRVTRNNIFLSSSCNFLCATFTASGRCTKKNSVYNLQLQTTFNYILTFPLSLKLVSRFYFVLLFVCMRCSL